MAGKTDLARPPPGIPGLSAKTGEGIDRLIEAMARSLPAGLAGSGAVAVADPAQGCASPGRRMPWRAIGTRKQAT